MKMHLLNIKLKVVTIHLARSIANKTTNLHCFLDKYAPEYIETVPQHWLYQDLPRIDVQVSISIAFLVICVPGTISQILVFLAYCR